MKLVLPQSDTFPLIEVLVETPKGNFSVTSDQSNREIEVDLPNGVTEAEVSATARFLTNQNTVDPTFSPMVLKERTVKPPVRPTAPKVEPKVEAPKAAPKSEVKPTVVADEDE